MKIQNKYFGSTLGMIMGPLSIFIFEGAKWLGEFLGILEKANKSNRCDVGCFPSFIFTIFFGALGYQLHKRRKFNPQTGWKKVLFIIFEIISIIVFLFSVIAISGQEDQSFSIISIISCLWVFVVYLALFTAKGFPAPSVVNKKLVEIPKPDYKLDTITNVSHDTSVISNLKINTLIDSISRKYFSPVENISIVLTFLFGLLVFLFYSIYMGVDFNPFSPSLFNPEDIFYNFFVGGIVSIITFSLTVHLPNDKLGKRLGILTMCTVIMVIVLSSTFFYSKEGYALIFLPYGNFFGGFIGFILGILARAVLNSRFTLLKIFIIVIAFFIFPAMTLHDYVVYGNPSMLTESLCKALSQSAQGECFDKLARTTNNPVACQGSYGDSSKMSKCYNDVTNTLLKEGKLDIAVCLNIPPAQGAIDSDVSRIGCVYEVAKKVDDITKCEVLPGGDRSLREGCIRVVASSFISLDQKTRLIKCTVLKNQNDQAMCYYAQIDLFSSSPEIRGNHNQCDLLSDVNKDICYYANSLYSGMPSCSMIVDTTIKQKCNSSSRL